MALINEIEKRSEHYGTKNGLERIIRQIDFAPTVAVLGGVRMPAQCEGAPAYQILAQKV